MLNQFYGADVLAKSQTPIAVDQDRLRTAGRFTELCRFKTQDIPAAIEEQKFPGTQGHVADRGVVLH